jgi:osmotically-inducible protein OsmY
MRTLLSFTSFIVVALVFQGCGPDVDPNHPGGQRIAKAPSGSNSPGKPNPPSTPTPLVLQGQSTEASSGQVASQSHISHPLKAPAKEQNAPPHSVEAQTAPQRLVPNIVMPTSAQPHYLANRSSSENPEDGAIAASNRMFSQAGTPSSTLSAPAAPDTANQRAWTNGLVFSSRNTTNEQFMLKIRPSSGRGEKLETLAEAIKNGDLVLVPASQGKAGEWTPTSNVGATEKAGAYSAAASKQATEIAGLDEVLSKYQKALRIDPAYSQWATSQDISNNANPDSFVQVAQTKIHFSSKDPSLTDQATQELNLIASLVKSDKRYVISIPESDGQRSLAQLTISYLIRHDVSPGRIFTIGYGNRSLFAQTTETNSVPITLYRVRDSNPDETQAFAFLASPSEPPADTPSAKGTIGGSSSTSAAGSPSTGASTGSANPVSSWSTAVPSASTSASDQSSQLPVASTSSTGSMSPAQPSHSTTSYSSRPGAEAGTSDTHTSNLSTSEPARGEALTREQLIQRMIQNGLRGEASLTKANIEVRIADNEIELTGTVANKQQKKVAGQVAEDYANGLKVLNHLKIQSDPSASPATPEH